MCGDTLPMAIKGPRRRSNKSIKLWGWAVSVQTSNQIYRTSDLPAGALSSIFVKMDMLSPSRASGRLIVSEFAGMRLVHARHLGGKVQIRRHRNHIRETSSHAIFVCIPISGEISISQGGRECLLCRDDLGLLDSRLEYQLGISDCSDTLWLRFTPSFMEARVRELPNAIARRIDGSRGIGLIASGFIKAVASQVVDLNDKRRDSLGSMAADLVAESAATGSGSVLCLRYSPRERTLERAKTYIENYLGDEDLSPAKIARGVGISTRYLSELFATDGVSPMSWVAHRRLTRCEEILKQQSWTPGIIAHVAFQHGFGCIPSFNRSFKKKFGLAPKEVMPGH